MAVNLKNVGKRKLNHRRKDYVMANLVENVPDYGLDDVPYLFGPKEIRQAYGIPTQFTERYGVNFFGQPAFQAQGWAIWDKRKINNFDQVFSMFINKWRNGGRGRGGRKVTLESVHEMLEKFIYKLNSLYENSSDQDLKQDIENWVVKYPNALDELRKVLSDYITTVNVNETTTSKQHK